MLKVEIRNDNSAYYKGFILLVKEDSAKVKYESSTQEHYVPFNYLRVPIEPTHLDINSLQLGEELEVYASPRENEPPAWWRSRVKKKGDSWIHVELILPDGTTSPEVVSNGTYRKPSKNPPLTKDSFNVFEYPCDDNRILELAKDEANHTDFCALVGPCLVLPSNDTLLAISLDPTVHKKVNLLFETHYRFLRARSELFADIERANHRLEQTKLSGSSGITETFTIKQEFVGLAIGSRGVNISAARDLPGISTVELHPQSADASVYEVLINGDDEGAIKRARAMLEFVEEPVMVPEDLISRVIGRNGRMLQEIVDKTQVIKIRIEDGPDTNKDEQAADNQTERMVPLWCIGSREAFDLAKMMIEYKIKTLKDLESVKDERDKLNSQLQNQGVPVTSRLGPPFRGGGGPGERYGGGPGGRGYPRGPPGGRGGRGGAMPIRGQPYRGGGGGGRGGGGMMRGGPPPSMRGGGGGRGGGPRRGRDMSEGDEEMRDDFNPSQGGGRGGPSGYRGGRGGGGRGRGGGRPYGGDRDGDKNSRNNNRQTGSMGDSQDQQAAGANGGMPPLETSGPQSGNGDQQQSSSRSAPQQSGGGGGGRKSQRNYNNQQPKAAGGEASNGNGNGGGPSNSNGQQQGGKPQRNRNGSGEAGKKRTHDGDEEAAAYVNGGDHGAKSSLPNGNVNAKAVNGVKA